MEQHVRHSQFGRQWRVLRSVLPSVGGLRVALRIFASALVVQRHGF